MCIILQIKETEDTVYLPSPTTLTAFQALVQYLGHSGYLTFV